MSQDPGDEPDVPAGSAALDVPPVTTPEPTPVPPEGEAVPFPSPSLEQWQGRALVAERRFGEAVAAYRKLRQENEGFRERIGRDVQQQAERRGERLVLRFIEVLDNLDRALQAAEQSYLGNPLVDGLILVRNQLLQILQKEGLERMPVLGLPFDPSVSEAVGTQAVSDPDHDHVVVRELLRGYRLRGRIARASRVIVGVYSEDAVAQPAASDQLVGADEVPAPQPTVDPAAETMRIDEKTLQDIFGVREKPKG